MKRIFAIFAVGVGLASQVILVAFLLDLPAVGVNSGGAAPAGIAVVVNLLLLAAFAVPHSVMARPAFKHWWKARIPHALERSVYILVSGILLAALCLWWQPLPMPIWQVEGDLARGAIRVLFFLGLLVLVWAIVSIDVLHFHGLRQAFGQSGEPSFSVSGPYRWVRHPIQSGLIVALWATPDLTAGHALFAGALTAYSVVATLKMEERDLIAAIGEPYQRYRQRVPALVPKLGRGKPERTDP